MSLNDTTTVDKIKPYEWSGGKCIVLPSNHKLYSVTDYLASNHDEEHLPNEYISDHAIFDKENSKCDHC